MHSEATAPVKVLPSRGDTPEPPIDPITQNIEAILDFYKREADKVSASQRLVEHVSGFVGQPVFLGAIIVFVALWVSANVFAQPLGLPQFDPPPFFWLGGIVSLGALLTSTVVLIRQDRLAKFEEQRAHLELQVNLLTEQKTTKLIHLIEELRHDLPMVRDRHDAEAEVFKQPTDPQQVLATMHEMREAEEQTHDKKPTPKDMQR